MHQVIKKIIIRRPIAAALLCVLLVVPGLASAARVCCIGSSVPMQAGTPTALVPISSCHGADVARVAADTTLAMADTGDVQAMTDADTTQAVAVTGVTQVVTDIGTAQAVADTGVVFNADCGCTCAMSAMSTETPTQQLAAPPLLHRRLPVAVPNTLTVRPELKPPRQS